MKQQIKLSSKSNTFRGVKTLYRKDLVYGNEVFYYKDRETNLIIRDFLPDDVEFLLMLKPFKQFSKKDLQIHLTDTEDNVEEDGKNLLSFSNYIVTTKKGIPVAFIFISSGNVNFSTANIYCHFKNSSKKITYVEKVKSTICNLCKKYNFYDTVYFSFEVDKSGNPITKKIFDYNSMSNS